MPPAASSADSTRPVPDQPPSPPPPPPTVSTSPASVTGPAPAPSANTPSAPSAPLPPPPTASPSARRLALGLIVFSLLSALLAIAALLRTQHDLRQHALIADELRNLRDINRALQSQTDQLRKTIEERSSLLQDKEARLAAAEQARLSLEQERSARLLRDRQREETARTMREKLATVLRPEDASILLDGSRLTIRLANQILFRSGESRLREDARPALQIVASLLREELAAYPVTVEGHTDNVPISDSMRSRFPSNWDLSAARAVSALRFLEAEGGIPSSRLSICGYGDTRPIAPNDTPEGQALNRRIEFVIQLDQPITPSPTPPTPASPAPGP